MITEKILEYMKTKNYRFIAESNDVIGHFINNLTKMYCDVNYKTNEFKFYFITSKLVKISYDWFSCPETGRFEMFENRVLNVVQNGGYDYSNI